MRSGWPYPANSLFELRYVAKPSKDRALVRTSPMSGKDRPRFGKSNIVLRAETSTSRDALRKGRERSRPALITLKTVLLAPIPNANFSTAVTVNPGLFRNIRKPNIPQNALCESDSPRLSAFLLYAFHPAKLNPSPPHRLRPWHTASHQVLKPRL
jgi:hypothetical protein